jgi:hypothetical protein
VGRRRRVEGGVVGRLQGVDRSQRGDRLGITHKD